MRCNYKRDDNLLFAHNTVEAISKTDTPLGSIRAVISAERVGDAGGGIYKQSPRILNADAFGNASPPAAYGGTSHLVARPNECPHSIPDFLFRYSELYLNLSNYLTDFNGLRSFFQFLDLFK